MEIRINKYAFIIGIFIAVAITVFVLAVLLVSGENNIFTHKFTIKVVFNNITGLKEGNNVWYSGMKVGTVKQITLKGNELIEVIMDVDEKAHPFIFKDASAKITSDGFVGNKIIVIGGGSERTGVIASGNYIKMVSAPGPEDMLAIMSQSNNNLLAITTDVLDITHKVKSGEGPVGKLVYDSNLALQMEHSLKTINEVAEASKGALANMQQFSARLNTQGSSLTNLLQDTLMFGQIKKTLVQLNRAVGRTEDFTVNLEKISGQLTAGDNTVNLLLNDPKSAQDIKMMIENLRAASIRLNQDLEALQQHWLLRGVLKPKSEKQKG
jgi:phospholipid/cholesterol/gamma-HCH transport system substrate-binding protein